MKKYNNLPTVILLAFASRMVITGASIGDSITMLALSGLFGFYHFIESNREPIVNKEIKDRLDTLKKSHSNVKDRVNSYSFGSSLKK